ncbi:uncharacterized protein BT62DRAFT_396339 [Guyanagaster necrorhizus]|uniref:Uncharacterized protein n=1 Tax=Guyanagaster necrorhizus TaxID=856835 RepID=A0A9P7W4D6_9AGAR|nr:uncharacterized protein BT62DRAFT_396339 [Guyanagaster necrorhizus MCA 3950]KAG7451091.1 hypothetical protein BT62DRAFT_396339 [Guyanagaster necrorhizus MCA 3950]
MSFSIARSLISKARPLAQRSPAATRSFYSPFAVLGSSSVTTAPPPSTEGWYEKQTEQSPDPDAYDGHRTYIVSPDTSSTPYHVPLGAYPVSSPFTEECYSSGARFSSSGNGFAHPMTTCTAHGAKKGSE